jgi:hypothetical protein
MKKINITTPYIPPPPHGVDAFIARIFYFFVLFYQITHDSFSYLYIIPNATLHSTDVKNFQ